jgi:hypothetical protein
MIPRRSHSDVRKSMTRAIVDPQPELDSEYARIRLTAYQIARLRALASRDCPRQTLPTLPSLQQTWL